MSEECGDEQVPTQSSLTLIRSIFFVWDIDDSNCVSVSDSVVSMNSGRDTSAAL